MIQLSKDQYLAEGLARTCFFHPNDTSLCIKVGKPEVDRSHLYKEINYYKKIGKKDVTKFDYHFYAEYHGTIETNLGEGFVYDLVRDETTGNVSKTLRHYMTIDNSPISDTVLNEALQRLKSQMITHKVFASDLKPRNICCKILNDHSIEMVIVDGIGHRDFLPFGDWFGVFAKRKVERRFKKNAMRSINEHRQMWLGN